MKKRLAALVLCLAMSMGTVVEAGAMAENLTSGSAEQTTETESFDVDVASEAGVSEAADDVLGDIDVTEEDLVVDDAAEDPAAADIPEEGEITGEETLEIEQETDVEVEFEVLFSSGEGMDETAAEFDDESIDIAGADVELGDGEVLASDWKQDTTSGKWRLINRDASQEAGTTAYYANCFVEITTKDATGAAIYEDVWYLFDAEGYLVTGRSVIPIGTEGYEGAANTEYFFMNEANATLKNEDETLTAPYNSNLGQMQKNYNWLWDGGAFHSYGSDGAAVTITANKIYKIGSEYYYLLANGVPAVGLKKTTYNGNSGYYFFESASSSDEIPGKMARNKWAKIGVDSVKGHRWWYFQSNGTRKNVGIVAVKLLEDKDTLYLVDQYGYFIKSKMVKAANGYYYYTNKYGHCYTQKLVKIGSYRYYFVGDGRRATWKNRWAKCTGAGNRYYYFGSVAGRVVEKKGWQKVTVSGKFIGWFYFTSNGNHYMNQWVGDRYFLKDGSVASGIVEVGGKTYFFERSTTSAYKGKKYKSTWVSYNGKWYYATSQGPLLSKRWAKIKGSYYYFNEDFSARTNRRAILNGEYGYLDSRGKFTQGWVVFSDSKNKVRYIDSKTGEWAKNISLVIDGLTYYFDADGYRINDLTQTKYFAQYKGSYYLEVDRINGVMTVYNKAKNVPLKTIRVSVGNPISLTRTGTYTLTRSLRWQPLMGPSWGQYGTHVTGGIYVHSIACTYANSYNLPAGEYLKLGSPASHGCIRCCVADAKWVYENCNGCKIHIFDGVYTSSEAFKGPLGRNPLTPLRGAGNFDPTDPAV